MCGDYKPGPRPDAFVANLRQDMPLPRKVALVLKNTGLKIVRFKNCCGHPGEPGC